MLKLYDWLCRCGTSTEHMVAVHAGRRPPRRAWFVCLGCGKKTQHERLMSAPAKYLGDRPLNIQVSGGTYDTMGRRRLPELPEFTGSTADEFCDFVQTKDYKAVKQQRRVVENENKAKRKRAAALRRGENVSMRHTPLPGDPSWR